MIAGVKEQSVSRMTLAELTWLFVRVSGVAMLALVLGHLLIVHYLNAPTRTNTAFVAGRWASAFWLGFDWLLLVTALLHGLAGLQTVVRERLGARTERVVLNAAILAVAALFVALGTTTILTFRPSAPTATASSTSPYAWVGDLLLALLTVMATATYLAGAASALYLTYRWLKKIPLGRWAFPGQWAWGLHRLSGLAVLGFLLVHILDISLLPLAPAVYDRTIAGYANPYLLPMEAALVAAVVFHALNGVRIIASEIWDERPGKLRGRLVLAVVAATVVLVLPSIVVLLGEQ